MKHNPFLPLLALLPLFLIGCLGTDTDVPVSWSTRVPDERIFGYWQDADTARHVLSDTVKTADKLQPESRYGGGTTYAVRRNPDGTANLEFYTFDPVSGEYRKHNDEAKINDTMVYYRLHFATLDAPQGPIHLASFLSGVAHEADDPNDLPLYSSFRYAILPSGDLAVHPFSRDFFDVAGLEKYPEGDTDRFLLGTPENFRAFVQRNLQYPALFDSVWVFHPVRDAKDLRKPRIVH